MVQPGSRESPDALHPVPESHWNTVWCGGRYSESVCSQYLRVSTTHGPGLSLGTSGTNPFPAAVQNESSDHPTAAEEFTACPILSQGHGLTSFSL